MASVTIEQAQASLPDLIRQLTPGDEVLITEDDQPVACLISAPPQPGGPARQPGSLRGSVLYMAPDFDAPLDDSRWSDAPARLGTEATSMTGSDARYRAPEAADVQG